MLRLAPLALLLAACSSDAPVEDAPSPEPAPATVSADAASTDACGLLTAASVQQHLPPAAGQEVEVADLHNAHRYNDDSRSCAWSWSEGHRVNLQATTKPDGGRLETWGSRMVAARVEDGYEPVDGLGDAAVFSSESASEVFWREGEGRIYSLTYTGPTPQDRMERDALVALAHSVGD